MLVLNVITGQREKLGGYKRKCRLSQKRERERKKLMIKKGKVVIQKREQIS